MSNKLDTTTKELILQYFDAFQNLYGIISMKRALRIIREQNPALVLSDADFIDFLDDFCDTEEYDHMYYIIVFDSEMYEEAVSETDPLKQFLISEYLYTCDDDGYEELKDAQEGYRFYIPAKEELLRYADEYYYEIMPSHLAMLSFLQEELHFPAEQAQDTVDDLQGSMVIDMLDTEDLDYYMDIIYHMGQAYFRTFEDDDQYELCIDLINAIREETRRHAFRGHAACDFGLKAY